MLAKKSDVPPEVIQKMEEMFPDMEIKYVGDMETIPDGVKAAIEQLEQMRAKSINEGCCMDCGKPIPDYPKTEEGIDGWKMPEGWNYFVDQNDMLVGFICEDCDDADSDTVLEDDGDAQT